MGREMGGRAMREGTYVYLWGLHVDVWQKTTKFCKAIILQLKKKLRKRKSYSVASCLSCGTWVLCCIMQHLPLWCVDSLTVAWGLSSCGVLVLFLCDMWNLSSQTRDWTKVLCIARRIPNYWLLLIVAQLCLTLFDPVDCSTPGVSVLQYLLEFAQVHVHWVGVAVLTISHFATLFSFCPQSFLASGSFPVRPLFTSGG